MRNPPRWPLSVLSFFCREELMEEIEGDLSEEYRADLDSMDYKSANLRHVLRSFGFLRWYALKKQINFYPNHQLTMFKNYLKIALRNMKVHLSYTIINLAGLSFGLACFLLMALYVQEEFSFDQMYTDHDRIYRVIEEKLDGQGTNTRLGLISFLAGPHSQVAIPEVQQSCRFLSFGRVRYFNPEVPDKEKYVEFVATDSTLSEVFDFNWLAGKPEMALKEPNSLILTQSLARSLFGETDAFGREVSTDRGGQPFKVTGIIEDLPENTHLEFEALISITTLQNMGWYQRFSESDWSSNNFCTYLLLNELADPLAVTEKINDLARGSRPEEDTTNREYALQPLADIHFHPADILGGFNHQAGNLTYVYVFLVVGLLVLILASVNYTSLATSRATKRHREIGIRKVTGAHRPLIINQILTESVLMTFFAAAVALGFLFLLLPYFNQFTGKSIQLYNNFSSLLFISLSVALLTGLLAGAYPAFIMSKMQPVQILKSGKGTEKGGKWFGNVLVVFQFAISTTLIIATLTAYLQLQFIQNKELGFQKELVLVTDINSGIAREKFETIKEKYLKVGDVEQVSVSSRVPGEWKNLPTVLVNKGQSTDSESSVRSFFIGADEDFLNTFDITLLEGENFKGRPADSLYVLINEEAARRLDIQEIEGRTLTVPSVRFNTNDQSLREPFRPTIIGIVKDFHFQSLHEKVQPLMIAFRNNPIHSIDYFTMKISGENISGTLAALEDALHTVDPDHIFEYHFLDEQLATFYEDDTKRGVVFGIAAGTALFIACLGLFALASFASLQRRKEIGIRKTFGASVTGITLMLSSSFTKLVIVSCLIAFPLGWWLTDQWLQSFAYRITPGIFIFFTAGAITLIIALGSVVFQTLKAAYTNPVQTLRNE